MSKILFTALLGFFSLFFIQDFLPFFQSGKLKGAYIPKENIEFTWKKWWSGEYQRKKDAFMNENFAYRNDLLRLNNQLDYSFFREIHASNIIFGKNAHLYEPDYIKSYLGLDFVGQATIDNSVTAIKKLQDSLAVRGKWLITVVAPGKGHFYPTNFPEDYPKTPKDSTNYNSFVESAKRLEQKNEALNLIDFNAWFLKVKDTSQYCIYPKTGIHWSSYTAGLALDSILNYIENLTNEDIPDMIWDGVEVTKECRSTDCDLEKALNLIFPLPNSEFAYPKIRFEKSNKKRFKVIVIADSFYWNLYYYNINKEVFGEGSEFWYYFSSIYPGRTNNVNARDLSLKEELESTDIVIILNRETGVHNIGSSFVEKANAVFN